MKLHRFILVFFIVVGSVHAAPFDYSEWDNVLRHNVTTNDGGKSSQVNYAAIAAAPQHLNHFLSQLSAVTQHQFDQWPKDQQLAFLINAYNAWTIALIIRGPADISSIKDLGTWFTSPWEKEFIPLLGQQHSLDNIEHQLIRGSKRFNEPRIHFAVNCASVGCPALNTEPYRGETIDQQLERATNNFLSDHSRNRLKRDQLEVSSIFKWYREDFEQGWRGLTNLEQFLAHYSQALDLTVEQKNNLRAARINIKFLDYDWRLNSTD